jgi:hypothetical protein
MSAALNNLINKQTNKVIKNATKLEVAVEALTEKFKESCPPKPELLKIVQQKNQIQQGLQSILAAFAPIQTAANVTNTTITAISAAVQVIKLIPIPTSVPPGIGIPINVVTILADSLDTLGDVLKGAKGAVSVVPKVADTITGAAESALSKLQQLEALVNKCIDELAEGMSQAEKNELINEIGNVAATAGDFEDLGLNVLNEEELESRLSGKPPGYYYKKTGFESADWQLFVEHNQDNEFSFPQRRIRAENINDLPSNIYKGVTVYNIYGKRWSYSANLKVLIDEAIFVIESLDNNWWRNNNDNFDPNAASVSGTGSGSGGSGTGSGSGGSGSGSGNNNLPPKPVVISNNLKQINLPVAENDVDNIITGTIEVNQPNQRVRFVANTGPTNFADFGSAGGRRGRFKVTIAISKAGDLTPETIIMTPYRETKRRFSPPLSPGQYSVVLYFEDMNQNQDALDPGTGAEFKIETIGF